MINTHRKTRIIRPLLLLFLFFLQSFFLPVSSSGAELSMESCQEMTAPIGSKSKEGGLWAKFETSRSLRNHSIQTLKLDSKTKALLVMLDYICETLSGVPANELADFVNRGISRHGIDSFKEQQVELGNPKEEVDLWIQYSQYAKTIENRTLNVDAVLKTFKGTEELMDQYMSLWPMISSGKSAVSVLQETDELTQRIDDFFSNDPTAVQVKLERSKVPYWDVDGSLP